MLQVCKDVMKVELVILENKNEGDDMNVVTFSFVERTLWPEERMVLNHETGQPSWS